MQLSQRLQEVANMVSPGSRVADIGCDHAYVSIYLVENNISPYVIAMDVNQGPIDRARINIEKHGYEDKIEVRKSDGLKELEIGEVDTLIMAGMGGSLMLQILRERRDIVNDVSSLILQPQSDVAAVRRELRDFGFLITEENMVKEDGKYYVMMKAQKQSTVEDGDVYELTKEEEYHFGKLLLNMRHNILHEFLLRERSQLENIYKRLIARPTEKTILRQEEILSMTKLIDRSLEYFN